MTSEYEWLSVLKELRGDFFFDFTCEMSFFFPYPFIFNWQPLKILPQVGECL